MQASNPIAPLSLNGQLIPAGIYPKASSSAQAGLSSGENVMGSHPTPQHRHTICPMLPYLSDAAVALSRAIVLQRLARLPLVLHKHGRGGVKKGGGNRHARAGPCSRKQSGAIWSSLEQSGGPMERHRATPSIDQKCRARGQLIALTA